MNENLDLTELLKDCPKGTKFYSSTFGNVEFLRIEKDDFINPIVIKWVKEEGNSYIEYLSKDGKFRGLGECIIFPSKDQRDWSKWHRPFKDGDIVATENGYFIGIIKVKKYNMSFETHCAINAADSFTINTPYYFARFATEEEKQKLFDAIKANGYRWNSETKTLEELILPKFKVGDSIQSKTDNNDKFTITNIDNNKFYYGCGKGHEFMIPVVKQDNWILIPNKFDPKNLKPFDKVLVNSTGEWFCDFFSHYDDSVVQSNCTCTGGCPYDYCIPYNDDTKHLIGKSIEEAPEFYRYWEE